MRKAILPALLPLIFLLSVSALAVSPDPSAIGVGSPAPKFEAGDLSGGKIASDDVLRSGKAIVLNFWGLRCGSCIMEMPHINSLNEKYGARANVYGINVDGIGAAILSAQIRKMKLDIRYTVVPDPEMKLVDLFRMAAAPLTVVIDARGIVRYRHEGYEPGDETKIEEALKNALDGGKGTRPRSKYAGSMNCALCHQTYYKGWVKTFHSTVIQDARKDPSAILADMNVPDLPFRKSDVHFTIGGHWDQRYLTRIDNEYYVLPRLWSVQSRKWRPYSTYGWQKRPYSRYCVGCHSVGYDPATGAIAEHAVGCESCHGPGSEHIEKPGKTNIVNPKRLPKERSDEVCASCHVRGNDLSGEYWFPIGWKPGEKLAEYLVPLDKKEGESDNDAIHRLWNKWKADREAQARARCEVCGIHQTARVQAETVSVDTLCTRCHEYQDRMEQHTHHKAEARVGCIDCHEQRAPDTNENKENDVHSYWYFLIHPQNCWDKDIHKKCGKCHTDKTPKWAYDIFIDWKKPVVLDH